MRLPIDVSTITFLAAGEPEPMTEHDSDRPRLDRDGKALFVVRLVALGDGQAEVLAVRIAGAPPKGIVQGAALRVRGLSATPWSMAERSGITYRAEAIEPVGGAGAAPTPSARQGA